MKESLESKKDKFREEWAKYKRSIGFTGRTFLTVITFEIYVVYFHIFVVAMKLFGFIDDDILPNVNIEMMCAHMMIWMFFLMFISYSFNSQLGKRKR